MKKVTCWFVFAFVCLCLRDAQSQNFTTDGVLAHVVQQKQNLQSASAKVDLTTIITPDFRRVYNVKAGEIFEPPFKQLTWAFKGDKIYQMFKDIPNKNDPGYKNLPSIWLSETKVSVFDEKRQLDVMFLEQAKGKGSTNINYRRQRTNDFSLLDLGYQILHKENRWLEDVLKSGDYQPVGTMQNAKFGSLLGFAGSSDLLSGGQKQTRFWIAPKFGYLAVRVESTNEVGSRKQQSVTELERVEQRGSVWFPMQGTRSVYEIEQGKPVLLTQKRLTVQSYKLNNVPDSLFSFKPQPGSIMNDDDTNTTWDVGPHGELIPWPESGTGNSMLLGWLFMGSLTTLLAIGIGLLWRRKRFTPKLA